MRHVRFRHAIAAAVCLTSLACIGLQSELAFAQFGPPGMGGGPAGPYGPMMGGGMPPGAMGGAVPPGAMGMGGPMGGQMGMGGPMGAQQASWSAGGMQAAPMYADSYPGGGEQGPGGCNGGECGGEDGGIGEPLGPQLALWESGTHWWVRGESLYMQQRGMHTPPLVTTSTPAVGAALPGATVLFGGENINNDFTFGEKITFGKWLTCGDALGFEANYFHLSPDGENFTATNAVLGIPLIDANTGVQDAFLVNFPRLAAGGNINVQSHSEVQSASALLRKAINFSEMDCGGCGCGCECCGSWRLDFIGGYRFFRLGEDLSISTTSIPANPVVAGGTTFSTFDRFDTLNEFHGGELGLDYQTQIGRFSTSILTKVGLGNLHQRIRIDGGNVVTVPGVGQAIAAGGILTGANNLGTFENDRFAVLPEVNLLVGYQLTSKLRATAGYNLLYIDNVVRPGDQINRALGANFTINDTQYILHGATAGLEFRY